MQANEAQKGILPEQDPGQDSTARAIPRVSIQAFCEAPETATAMQQAGADRRLAKTHFNLQMGSIRNAIEHFADSPTPNLLIVESRDAPEQLLEAVSGLAEVCDSGTKVIIIGHVNDIGLYRNLIDSGVSEYVVAPIKPLQLIGLIADIYLDPDAPVLGRSIAFVGAKGGVGSSTVAHNVSWIISEQMKQDVVLADMDLPFGTAGLNFNQDPPQGISEAILSPEQVDEVMLERLLTECSDHLSLLAAPGTLDREADFDKDTFEDTLDLIRKTTPLLVIDVPHLWTSWSRKTLREADEVVITAAPDLANLRNARNLVDILKNSRQNDAPPILVINMAGVPKRPEITVKDFSEALGIKPSLVIPFDPQLFGTAANNGQMIEELSAQSKPAEGFRELTRMLTGGREMGGKSNSFIKPLISKLMGKKG
ncbi:MAG: CtpF protein [Hyphomicrobiales bacterium]|nr:MAG: CtpF protein [Hyphomicrobiales bacterium]